MEKRISMHLILCLLMSFSIACKKSEPLINEDNKEIPAQPEQPITPPTNPVTPTEPDADATVYEFGRGSGSLDIDGNTFTLASKAIIKIKSGTYTTINIVNIKGTESSPVYVKNDGQVTITQAMYTNNIENVVIAGDNNKDIPYGYKFENISYRAIELSGKMNGVTLKNMSFKDVNDYVISSKSNNELSYNGSKDTRIENFKILNCLFDDAGTILFGGSLSKDQSRDMGFFKGVEIANNIFRNTNAGSVCTFNNVQDYDIHHNVVTNINQTNNNHNGVFFMQGNGKFHHNQLTNYQGNAIRMWLYSRGNTPVTNEIYNNICYKTRKYGAFELQSFDNSMYPGKSTYANAKVYNNTVGLMNTSKDWQGQILDLYNTGGTLEYYNNLGFSLYSNESYKPVTNMINDMSNTKIIINSNNVYTTENEAVKDLTNFSSKITGVGAVIN